MKISEYLFLALPGISLLGLLWLAIWVSHLRDDRRYGKGTHTLRIYHMNEEPTIHKSTNISILQGIAADVVDDRYVTTLEYRYANGKRKRWSKS